MADTAKIAQPIGSGKKYAEIAETALPILVSQAKAGQTIFYSTLAEELELKNPRYTAWILGSIGQTLINLTKKWEQTKIKTKYLPIPKIQSLVVSKTTGKPSPGINPFISRKKDMSEIQEEVFNYLYWDEVLNELQLTPAHNISGNLIVAAADLPPKGRGGESPQHRALKEYIHNNPSIIGITKRIIERKTEWLLPSGDCCDVYFRYFETHNTEVWFAVEVKSTISSEADIVRGLYQCVKYKAVMEAIALDKQVTPIIKVILVMGGKFPRSILRLKNLLDVDVIDKMSLSWP